MRKTKKIENIIIPTASNAEVVLIIFFNIGKDYQVTDLILEVFLLPFIII